VIGNGISMPFVSKLFFKEHELCAQILADHDLVLRHPDETKEPDGDI
jgi:hypothetical protein